MVKSLIAERKLSCVIKGEEGRVWRISSETETNISSRYSEGSGKVDVGGFDGIYQTIKELDFERGTWTVAADGGYTTINP